VKQTSSAL